MDLIAGVPKHTLEGLSCILTPPILRGFILTFNVHCYGLYICLYFFQFPTSYKVADILHFLLVLKAFHSIQNSIVS